MRNPITAFPLGARKEVVYCIGWSPAEYCVHSLLLLTFLMPTLARAQGVVYLECNEEVGIKEETINISTFGRNGLETQHQKLPPKFLEANQLRKHKVVLNPMAASGNWRSDSNPSYYPTHISFSEGRYPASDILKISREKRSDNTTTFTRITMQSSSTPFPIKKEQYVEIEATGTCRVVPVPKTNLF